MTKIKKISIIGDGGWGTALAVHLSRKGYRVVLWGAFPEYVAKVAKTRLNEKFLPGVKIPSDVMLTSDLAQAVEPADLIVFAVPSQFAHRVIERMKDFSWSKKIFLSVTKGFDTDRLWRISEMVEHLLGPSVRFAVLSGPTIAREMANGIPTTAVVACKNLKTAQAIQNVFHSEGFRIYASSDVAGLEIGGSIKNVIALACGICDGLGFGTNTKAAIVTRGLFEISRLGKIYGAKPQTFAGLSGLGDLITTCFNETSRNRSVGQMLGEGRTLKQILSGMSMVAEGVETVKAAHRLARKHKIEMPITEEIFKILYKRKSASKAVKDLMSRKAKAE